MLASPAALEDLSPHRGGPLPQLGPGGGAQASRLGAKPYFRAPDRRVRHRGWERGKTAESWDIGLLTHPSLAFEFWSGLSTGARQPRVGRRL